MFTHMALPWYLEDSKFSYVSSYRTRISAMRIYLHDQGSISRSTITLEIRASTDEFGEDGTSTCSSTVKEPQFQIMGQ